MNTKRIVIALALLTLTSVCPATSFGQTPSALAILDDALGALGGEAKIRSYKSIYFSASGFEDSEVNAQPFAPGKPARNAHEEKLAVFLDGRRLAYELRTDRGDGTRRHRRFYFTDTRRIVADFITRSVFPTPVQFPSADRDQDARRMPHAFLLEAVANSSTVRYEGSRSFNRREHDVVSVTLRNARVPISLYLDKQSRLLSKYEFTADFPGLGPSLFEYTFSGWAPHAELGHFPSEHEIRINGKTFRGLKIERAGANSPEANAMLELPADLEGFLVPPGTVKEIAKGVYFVYGVGGFQPMFAEFKDFVVAIEAPSNVPVLEDTPVETIGNVRAASDEFIAKIKQTVPNKPIRYVVITHPHADHFGGLRSFIPDKPIVLTTAGNKAYYEKFVPELKVEVIDKKRTIADDTMAVELIDVGTEDNIVVWLPKPRYLFQGDLFYFNNEATFPLKDRMTVMPFFAKWLKANKLAPERIYGFHSTMFGSMQHIDKILKLSGDKAP